MPNLPAWIKKDKKKSARTTAPNHQSGSSITKRNDVIPGQTLNNIITYVQENLKSDVKKHEENGTKTYYQENDTDEENLFVGFTYPQIMDKLMALNEKLAEEYDKLSQAEKNSRWVCKGAKICTILCLIVAKRILFEFYIYKQGRQVEYANSSS